MTSLIWEDKFNTGVEALDVQHRKIFDYMTTIYNELSDNHQKCDPFNGMLDHLELLCQMHFLNEQQLIDESSYPTAAEHKHLHDQFLANIARFKIDTNQCHTPSIINDFIKLRDDFISHLLNESMILSNVIKSSACKDSTDVAS